MEASLWIWAELKCYKYIGAQCSTGLQPVAELSAEDHQAGSKEIQLEGCEDGFIAQSTVPEGGKGPYNLYITAVCTLFTEHLMCAVPWNSKEKSKSATLMFQNRRARREVGLGS